MSLVVRMLASGAIFYMIQETLFMQELEMTGLEEEGEEIIFLLAKNIYIDV